MNAKVLEQIVILLLVAGPPEAAGAVLADSVIASLPDTLSVFQRDRTAVPLPDSADFHPAVLDSAAFSENDSAAVRDPGGPEARADSIGIPAFEDARLPLFPAWAIDSAAVRGTAYTSAADFFQLIPGLFLYRDNVPGQPAQAALFAYPAAEFQLEYDGLRLDDPLSGAIDLNLVPALSIERAAVVLSSSQRRCGARFPGSLIQVASRDMAGLPIKSQVSYHTGGSGYDDIDARLGARITPRLSLNAGGVIKGYDGAGAHRRFSGHKINLKLERRLSPLWRMRYVLLHNLFDRDRFLPGPLPDAPDLTHWHEKLVRTDHGLVLQRGRGLLFNVQWTGLEREQYGSRRALLDQTLSAGRIFCFTRARLGAFEFGGSWSRIRAEINGPHHRWSAGGWFNAAANLPLGLAANLGLTAHKVRGYEAALEPEVLLTSPSVRTPFFVLWRRRVRPPSLEQLHSDDVLRHGSPLQPALGQMFAAGLEAGRPALHGELTLSAHLSERSIVLAAEPSPRYRNRDGTAVYALDLSLDAGLCRDVRASGSISLIESEQQPVNRPDLLARFALEGGIKAFSADLEVRLKIGAEWLGRRSGPRLWYASDPEDTISMDPVLIPVLQSILIVKDATFYLTYENPFSQSYERIYGYPAPGPQFRWGFIWAFVD